MLKRPPHRPRKLTDEQEREIAFRAQVEDVKHLALEFGVSDRTVYRVWGQARKNESSTNDTGTSPAE